MSRRVALSILAALAIAVGSYIPEQAYAGGMPAVGEESAQTPLERALQEIAAEKAQHAPAVQNAPGQIRPMTMDMTAGTEENASRNFEPAPRWRFVERVPDSSFLGLSIGFYDTFGDETAGLFNIEWQPGWRIARVVQPVVGGFASSNGSLYGYAGLGVPLKLSDRITLRPSFSAGVYHDGGGVDLGQALVYRGGLELSYELDNRSRIGLEASVLTNGESAEKSDRTETLMLKYTVPLETLEGFDFQQ